MISKKNLAKIKRLRKRRELLKTDIRFIERAMNKIDKELFGLIVRKEC